MNLTREQMLAEMGITPIWRLRDSPVVAVGAEDNAAPNTPETAVAEQPTGSAGIDRCG